jgi:hypothetical protein
MIFCGSVQDVIAGTQSNLVRVLRYKCGGVVDLSSVYTEITALRCLAEEPDVQVCPESRSLKAVHFVQVQVSSLVPSLSSLLHARVSLLSHAYGVAE